MSNVHPLIVHFPIALMAMSAVCEIAALLWEKEELSRVGWWTQLAGTLAVGVAVTSGLLAEKTLTFPAEARPLFAIHEQLAFCISALFGTLLLWRIGSRSKIPPGHRSLYLLLLVAGVIILFVGAWYGGEMVYSFGVGVRKTPL